MPYRNFKIYILMVSLTTALKKWHVCPCKPGHSKRKLFPPAKGGHKFPQWEANQHAILLAYFYPLLLVTPVNISSLSLDSDWWLCLVFYSFHFPPYSFPSLHPDQFPTCGLDSYSSLWIKLVYSQIY
jgi:hypothetical protein